MGVKLQLQPITFQEAKTFIRRFHRHHLPAVGWKFGIGVNDGISVVGVIVVGRPVSRLLDDGLTLEVTRCCTDGTRHACSCLYGAAWRATKAFGFRRLITYTLASEPGTSLRAAGWRELYVTKGGSWDRPGRHRVDNSPTSQKTLWEAV
jgi:hypothetical protein